MAVQLIDFIIFSFFKLVFKWVNNIVFVLFLYKYQQNHNYSVLNKTYCVAAPVQTVEIERINNIITCRSDGIYPEPDLTWDPSPSSPPETIKDMTKEGLYIIRSSVRLSDTGSDYSCTVSTSTSKKRITLLKQSEYGKVCRYVCYWKLVQIDLLCLFSLLCFIFRWCRQFRQWSNN